MQWIVKFNSVIYNNNVNEKGKEYQKLNADNHNFSSVAFEVVRKGVPFRIIKNLLFLLRFYQEARLFLFFALYEKVHLSEQRKQFSGLE